MTHILKDKLAIARDIPDMIKIVYRRGISDSRKRLHVTNRIANDIRQHCVWDDEQNTYICTSQDDNFPALNKMLDKIADERGFKK